MAAENSNAQDLVGLDPYVSHSHKLAPENLGQISEK